MEPHTLKKKLNQFTRILCWPTSNDTILQQHSTHSCQIAQGHSVIYFLYTFTILCIFINGCLSGTSSNVRISAINMGHRCERHHRTTQGYLTTYPSYIWIIELQLYLFSTPNLFLFLVYKIYYHHCDL